MFTNYSQTYAAAITTLVGLVVSFLASRGITIIPADPEFAVGVLINLGGIIWTLTHRVNKGDITALGKRVG